jgi:hypothetical protein
MLKSLISKGLSVPHRCENRYKSVEYKLHIRRVTPASGETLKSLGSGITIGSVSMTDQTYP